MSSLYFLDPNSTKIKQTRDLTEEESDGLFHALAEYLIKENLLVLGEKCLSYIEDQTSIRFLMNMGKLQYKNGEYKESIEFYKQALDLDKQNKKAYIETANALFFLGIALY